MSLASDILALRRDKSSSIETLLSLLEWARSAPNKDLAEMRAYSVAQAADTVLLNVTVHALQAQDSAPPHETRQAIRSRWWKRRTDSPQVQARQSKQSRH
jgi:hypothetical protein